MFILAASRIWYAKTVRKHDRIQRVVAFRVNTFEFRYPTNEVTALSHCNEEATNDEKQQKL